MRRRYRIAVLSTNRKTLEHRSSFLRALSEAGNAVTVIPYEDIIKKPLTEEEYLSRNEAVIQSLSVFTPDFLLLFCIDYKRMHLSGKKHLLALYPYVTVWDSNPLNVLCFLNEERRNHIRLLVIDSHISAQLRALGFPQASYMPYYYADPAVFAPARSSDAYAHPVSFAGTFTLPSLIPPFFPKETRPGWTEEMKTLRKGFHEQRLRERWYVDVFDYADGKIDRWSREYAELSSHLMYLQKTIERIQMFQTLADGKEEVHVYGGLQASYHDTGKNELLQIRNSRIHLHDFIDKHVALPVLYASSQVNLCCTQFPRACHERVFQVAACGGFILHEWKEDVPALFEPDKEIALYRSLAEIAPLVTFYRTHERARKEIAERARRRFLSDHTPLRRAEAFTDSIEK
ncbi:MAG: glycosyltransferase [Thermodesulfovibrionales bacterium]